MTGSLARGAIACLCAIIVWASPLAAERLAAEPRTNQGAKYQLDTGTKFHTNPGENTSIAARRANSTPTPAANISIAAIRPRRADAGVHAGWRSAIVWQGGAGPSAA